MKTNHRTFGLIALTLLATLGFSASPAQARGHDSYSSFGISVGFGGHGYGGYYDYRAPSYGCGSYGYQSYGYAPSTVIYNNYRRSYPVYRGHNSHQRYGYRRGHRRSHHRGHHRNRGHGRHGNRRH